MERTPLPDDSGDDPRHTPQWWKPLRFILQFGPGRPQISNYSIAMVPRLLFILYITSYFTITACCSSRSTPKPRPSIATARPNVTFETYACPEAYAKWYCLNGATCFAIKIRDSILYNCECADGYMGQRCEFKDLDGSYLPSREREIQRAGIAGGMTVLILIIAFFYLTYFLTTRLRRRYVAYCPDQETGTAQQHLLQSQRAKMADGRMDCKKPPTTLFENWRAGFLSSQKPPPNVTSLRACEVAIVSQSPYLGHCAPKGHCCPHWQGHCPCQNRQGELSRPQHQQYFHRH